MTACVCGAVLPQCEVRATHGYIPSTPECWWTFGEVVAREFEDPALLDAVHQLTVDAYAAQHPAGQPPKSLDAHLVSLYVALERGRDPSEAREALKNFVETPTLFPELPVPANLGPLTIADVAAASHEQHCETVRRWAQQVWSAWSESHARIAALLDGRA
jgi:Family of unknown function (DUF5946)